MVPFPHNKNNKKCPNYGNLPLPEPQAHAPPRTVRVRQASAVAAGLGAEEEEDDSASEDGNDNVCHACSQPGELLECDECPRVWHDDCLPLAARVMAEAERWLCPICVGMHRPAGFIGNPARALPGRGGGQHCKRFRSAIEGSKAQRKRNKAAGRSRELPFKG
jgi:hypothetical protein